jgi:hypothetical protein
MALHTLVATDITRAAVAVAVALVAAAVIGYKVVQVDLVASRY